MAGVIQEKLATGVASYQAGLDRFIRPDKGKGFMANYEAGGFENQPQARPYRPALQSGDEAIWDSVLRETSEADNPSLPLGPAEREALRCVARRYQGQAMALQPVAAALVQAVILPQLPADPIAAKFWQEMFVQIAQTQLEDDAARDRLESVWMWLQENVGLAEEPLSSGNRP
jgi:hypothetical protein